MEGNLKGFRFLLCIIMKNRFFISRIWYNKAIVYFEFFFLFVFIWDAESVLSILGGADVYIVVC